MPRGEQIRPLPPRSSFQPAARVPQNRFAKLAAEPARPALEIPALSPESGRRARSQLARWFVGAVGEGDAKDFTALGDTVNTGSRLTSLAAAGEFLISAETAETGGLETAGLERRTLELRGRKQTIDAWVCKGSEVSLGAAAA